MDPNFALAHVCMSESYVSKGIYQEAVAEMQKAIDLSGGRLVFVSLLGYEYARAGRRVEAIKILNELKARSKREFVSPNHFVAIYAGLGDEDQAFAWLEKSYEERTDEIAGLKVVWELEPLRSDPRYTDLLRRVGLPL